MRVYGKATKMLNFPSILQDTGISVASDPLSLHPSPVIECGGEKFSLIIRGERSESLTSFVFVSIDA